MTLQYIGNGAYCYANATAMALTALGHAVDAGYVECLTAFGVGAQCEETPGGRLPFFDSKAAAPARVVEQALRTFGCVFDSHVAPQETDPDGALALGKLKVWLESGPVIVGPVDMGLLTCNPNHRYLGGSDHYVLVYELSEEAVFFHDPAGFPHVSMGRAAFVKAWQAEAITIREGAYSMWGCLRRVTTPSADEMFAATDRRIAEQFRWEQAHCRAEEVGPGAFRALAAAVAGGVPAHMLGHLMHFALPVAARRCGDFAAFYAPYDAERSRIKREQARCHGGAHSALMRGDHKGFAAVLQQLADLEAEFQARCCITPSATGR